MTFLDSVHNIQSSTICGLYVTSHFTFSSQTACGLKTKSHINVDVNIMHDTNRVRWAANAAQPKEGHLFIRMLFLVPCRAGGWYRSVMLTLRWKCDSLTGLVGKHHMHFYSIKPKRKCCGTRGTFLVREHRQWSKCQFKKKLDCGNIATFEAWAGTFQKCLCLANGS